MAGSPRWWETRPAQGRQAKTYTCPFCHRPLLAMNPNTLLFPEGDRGRRRHAHTACVARARQAGRLVSKSEWERANRSKGPVRSWWRRLFDASHTRGREDAQQPHESSGPFRGTSG